MKNFRWCSMIGENICRKKTTTYDNSVPDRASDSQFNAPFQLQMWKLRMAHDFPDHWTTLAFNIHLFNFPLSTCCGCIMLIALLCVALYYVSPSNEGRHVVFVWFFLPLLLSEACLGHNFFVFRDRSMIFGMWVHDHKAVCRVP